MITFGELPSVGSLFCLLCWIHEQHRQRQHLTASKNIYIVLHEQWTRLFRPPLTHESCHWAQQSMKHKEVAATQITWASSYRQFSFIQHEESHPWCITLGTWTGLLQYAHVDNAHGTRIKSWCVVSTSSTDVDRCHFGSHLNAPKTSTRGIHGSWTTGLINKVIMLEAFRRGLCLRNNKYYIYSFKASFIH